MQVVLRWKVRDTDTSVRQIILLVVLLEFSHLFSRAADQASVYQRLTNTASSRKHALMKGYGLKSIKIFKQSHDAASIHTRKQGMHLLSPPSDFPDTHTPSQAPDTCPETALTFTWVHRFSSLKWKKEKSNKKNKLHSLGLLCKLNWIFFCQLRSISQQQVCLG